VLWEALAGRRLFDAENEGAVIVKVLDGRRTPPSHFADDLPHGLDQIVLRGLSYRADERYPTAREMAVAIEASCALPTPREIGEWVQSVASEALAERAACVAELESEIHVSPSSLPVFASSPAKSSSIPPRPASHRPTPPAPVGIEGPGTTMSLVTPRALAPVSKQEWPTAGVLVAIAIALGAAALGVFLLWTFHRAADVAVTESNSTAAPALAPAPRDLPREVVEPVAEPVAPSASASIAQPEPSPPAEPPRARHVSSGAAPAKPATSTMPTRTVNCDPPYTITFDGVRRYKPECLK
jgi:serine/threonine-protein kinase